MHAYIIISKIKEHNLDGLGALTMEIGLMHEQAFRKEQIVEVTRVCSLTAG